MHITIHNLTKVYREKRGLFAAELAVQKGEMVAVVGKNGAGKSTLLKILANWILPDSGQVFVDGIDVKNRMAMVRKIGFVPEIPNLFELFSVEYNLKIFARLFRIPLVWIENVLTELALQPFRKNKIHLLSKGLRQRVSIARALLANPQILLLDEPTSGIDVAMTREIHRQLMHHHTSGKTILFTSHQPEEIKTLATRVVVLQEGYVVFDDEPRRYFESDFYKELTP